MAPRRGHAVGASSRWVTAFVLALAALVLLAGIAQAQLVPDGFRRLHTAVLVWEQPLDPDSDEVDLWYTVLTEACDPLPQERAKGATRNTPSISQEQPNERRSRRSPEPFPRTLLG